MRPVWALVFSAAIACSNDSSEPSVDAGTDVTRTADANIVDLGTAPDLCSDCDVSVLPDGSSDVGTDMSASACAQIDTTALRTSTLVENPGGNYAWLVPDAAESAPVNEVAAHVVNDAPNHIAAFIVSTPTVAQSRMALDRIFRDTIQATYPAAGVLLSPRHVETFLGEPAVAQGTVRVPGGVAPDVVRDELLAAVVGSPVTHAGAGTFTPTTADDPLLVSYSAVQRASDALFIVAVAPRSRRDTDGDVASRIADLTSAGAVAPAGTALETACIELNQGSAGADVLLVLDNSASLDDELVEFESVSGELLAVLEQYNVSWRVGVATATCVDIAGDDTISTATRDLFLPSGESGPCAPLPAGLPRPALSNGKICDDALATDPAVLDACVATARRNIISTEHTMSIAPVVAERLLPRDAGAADRLRPDAATIFLTLTDEFDDVVNWATAWTDTGMGGPQYDPTLDAAYDEAMLRAIVDPFVSALLHPDVDAAYFSIAWIPGSMCPTAAEAAVGIANVAADTGGALGSICDDQLGATMREFGRSIAGHSSNIRIEGVPDAGSIALWLDDDGNSAPMVRSRADGWDYDAIVNRVTFQGPNPPQTGDRVVIAYRRWEGSIRQCNTDVDCPREQKYRCINGSCL